LEILVRVSTYIAVSGTKNRNRNFNPALYFFHTCFLDSSDELLGIDQPAKMLVLFLPVHCLAFGRAIESISLTLLAARSTTLRGRFLAQTTFSFASAIDVSSGAGWRWRLGRSNRFNISKFNLLESLIKYNSI
jgi:hypothetical protein